MKFVLRQRMLIIIIVNCWQLVFKVHFFFPSCFAILTEETLTMVYTLWFSFSFPLFLCVVIHDNEYKTKTNKIESKIKLNHNIYTY